MRRIVMRPMDERSTASLWDEFPLHDDVVARRNGNARCQRKIVDDLYAMPVVGSDLEGLMHRVCVCAVEKARAVEHGRAEGDLAAVMRREGGLQRKHGDRFSRRPWGPARSTACSS